jgi:hypothetical protein
MDFFSNLLGVRYDACTKNTHMFLKCLEQLKHVLLKSCRIGLLCCTPIFYQIYLILLKRCKSYFYQLILIVT